MIKKNTENVRFSKPPPSATRPPLRVLKPLELLGFRVNGQNAVGAVGAGDSGSPRYKNPHSPFLERSPPLADPEWLGLAAIIAWPVITILLATQFADFRCRPGDVTTTNGRELCAGARR